MNAHHTLCTRNRMLVVIVVFMTLVNIASVFSLEIARVTIPPVLGEGQTVSFTYELSSDAVQEAVVKVGALCPKTFIPEETLLLQVNGTVSRFYDSRLVVNRGMEPQNCTAYVRILAPVQQTFSKNFSILTQPSFSLTLQTCADAECATPKKVFTFGDEIFLQYVSSVQEAVVKATLTSSDGKAREVSLPFNFRAEQTGTYILEVSASKQGYANASVKEEFGVIEKPAEIKEVAVKDITTPPELRGKASEATGSEKTLVGRYVLIAGLVVIGASIVVVILLLLRRRRNQMRGIPMS